MPEKQCLCITADESGAMERALEVLLDGGVVALPTDTVYGVAAHAFLPAAVARLYTIKGRPRRLPVPLLLPDADALRLVCAPIPQLALDLAARFWPGPLSLVLHKRAVVPCVVTGGGPTVAVRVPDHALIRELCRRLGAPVAATSANLHGESAPITARDVQAALGERLDLILDGGPSSGGQASTVLDLTLSPPGIVRAGPISWEELASLISFRH